MNVAERKLDLIAKISSISDISILEELNNLLDFELNNSTYKLSEEQIKRIEEAKEDYVVPEKKANLEIEKWLKEQ